MTIYIAQKGKIGLRLWLPLSLLTVKPVIKLLCKYSDRTAMSYAQCNASKADESACEVSGTLQCQQFSAGDGECTHSRQRNLSREQVLCLYRALRDTVRLCGHFDLVYVCSEDGDVVRIRI